MKLITLAIVSFAASLGTAAFADDDIRGSGAFLEPGISYQTLDSNVNYPAPLTNSSATLRGFGVLLRGGVHVWERVFVAADARYGMNRYNDNANNYSVDAQSWDLAPTIGVQMADWGVRLYAGYVLAGDLDPKSANGYDFRFENPNGWRVGAGLKLQHLSLNVEWQNINYGKTTVQSVGGFAPNATTDDIEFRGEGLVVSLTFPIEFN